MSAPLTGLAREIATTISATVRRVASNDRRDATVAEMATDVADMLAARSQAGVVKTEAL